MDAEERKANNPAFARAARLRVWHRYIHPEEKTAKGIYKDAAATVKLKEPEVQEKDLGADFFG